MRQRFWRMIYIAAGQRKYIGIPFNLLLINWLFQRVLRLNSTVPVSVHYTSRIDGFNNMLIGERVLVSLAVSGGCYIAASEEGTVEIGDGTLWAWNFCLQTANHDYFDRDKYYARSVKIGKNCWFGNSVTVLPGVELGDNVTVGANSVVTKSFPGNVVIAGCPARIIRELKAGADIKGSED